jgi:hypothetical protein
MLSQGEAEGGMGEAVEEQVRSATAESFLGGRALRHMETLCKSVPRPPHVWLCLYYMLVLTEAGAIPHVQPTRVDGWGLTGAPLVQLRRKAAYSFWCGGVSRIDMLASRITNNLLLAAVKL